MIAILGILTLGSGYVIANVVKSPLDALLLFFVAVILSSSELTAYLLPVPLLS